ncbi:hypothetical protein G4Y79_16285 [Phototrophicus methaneseepsis]|uniref:Uncharacterized protein n=1 Tax=Phototrophicus methaneseepsis TaxID=2710758 RepID=A0A7S8E6G5_9CHLR|nr:hypothetical protein [Phototrophicus methaneseepsis]QPC81258.1 hypothetical protein G4Y79_16285 [Phototrophicus methaneseepsis]
MDRMIQWLAVALVSFVLIAGPAVDSLSNIAGTSHSIEIVSGGTPGDCC